MLGRCTSFLPRKILMSLVYQVRLSMLFGRKYNRLSEIQDWVYDMVVTDFNWNYHSRSSLRIIKLTGFGIDGRFLIELLERYTVSLREMFVEVPFATHNDPLWNRTILQMNHSMVLQNTFHRRRSSWTATSSINPSIRNSYYSKTHIGELCK